MNAPTRNGIDMSKWMRVSTTKPRGVFTMKRTTVGIDLAKNVFQIHGIDEHGKVLVKSKRPLIPS